MQKHNFFLKRLVFTLVIGLINSSFNLNAQSYQLESINQNYYRNQQLLGKYDSSVSFTNQYNIILPNSKTDWKKPRVKFLPLVLGQQFNSHHPFGWNDGAMIQSKGYQTLVRAGVNIRYGIIEAQIAPEFVFATNGNYNSSALFGNSNPKSYRALFPGQSFIKAAFGPISIGVSTENLWWGPGINSSLLLSNNAPGFLHATVGTKAPIKTPIGSFEFNIIGAKLNSDASMSYENDHLLLKNISDDWRYLNAYVISWQPKWVKGLFIGFARSLQQYGKPAFDKNVGLINKYLPVIGLPTNKANFFSDDTSGTDQLASLFLRWVLPKANAEVYIEFGKNDYGLNLRDYLLAPSHSTANTIGFRKLIAQSNTKYVQLETELTQMSASPNYLVRLIGNWYSHTQIFQGYTHQNQILGAGAGYGTNVQTIGATWVNKSLRNGFFIQRFERDPVFKLHKWTDISIGWMPQWTYKNMLLSAKIQLIRSNNYIWEKGNNPFNFHSRLMVQYNFK